MPVTERRIELEGIPTAVLEGGAGPPVVLLHGPGEFAAKWFAVIPELVATHRVIAPDLPGHGASGGGGAVDGERVLAVAGRADRADVPGPAGPRGTDPGRRDRRPLRRAVRRASGAARPRRRPRPGRVPAGRRVRGGARRVPSEPDRRDPRSALGALRVRPGRPARAARRSMGGPTGRTPWIARERPRPGPPCRASWRRSGCRPSRKPSSRRSRSPRS